MVLKLECDEALKDLDRMEEALTARFLRGELTAMKALGELTEIKITRFKVLECYP